MSTERITVIAKSNPCLPRLKLPRRILVESRAKSVLLGRVLSFDPCWPIVSYFRSSITIRKRGSSVILVDGGATALPSSCGVVSREPSVRITRCIHTRVCRLAVAPTSFISIYNGIQRASSAFRSAAAAAAAAATAAGADADRSPFSFGTQESRRGLYCSRLLYRPVSHAARYPALPPNNRRQIGDRIARCYVTRRSLVDLRAYLHGEFHSDSDVR